MKEKISDLYNNLLLIYDEFGFDKNTLRFIDTFHIEIADLFKILDIKESIQFLINFDKSNEETYLRYLNDD